MADHTPPHQDPAPVYSSIEWETPRPRPQKPSLLRRLWPTAPSGPDRPVSTPPQPIAAAENKEAAGANTTLPTHTSTHPGPTAVRPPIRSCFDAILPPHRTYLSLSRKRFLLVLLAITLALLALILGLSIGLTRKSGGSPASLPLPTSSGIHTGELTYYAPGLGACGWTSGDGDAIVAVSHEVFDAAGGGNPNPNANPLCGKMIRVERDRGGGRGNKSVDVVVVDRCVGCKPTDLDLSPSTFAELADMDLGRVVGSWAWL